MNMKNILKKICICGASLMMISSFGVGINNASAKKVHRHARTHRIAINSNRYLFNQGRNDGKRYGRNFNIMLPSTSSKYSNSTYNNTMLHLIENNYNHSYQNGFRAGMNDAVGGHQPSVIQNIGFLTRKAKKLARHHHLNSHNVYAYFHKDTRPKYTKRHAKKGHKNTKKYRKAKVHHSKKQVAKHHTIKRNRKLKKNTKKYVNKRSNKASTKATKHSSQSYDETDGGKYYSWGQLKNALEGPDAGTSDEVDNKIQNTIMHNLNHYNYKQDDYLLSGSNADELSYISPKLFNDVNNAYGFSYGMRKVL